MTEKRGKIQGKWDLVRVSGEFELTEFELAGFYCIVLWSGYCFLSLFLLFYVTW